ncbi:reduced folate transporter isoform X1 [Cervus elaphus]|uniref:reduced folate transporter isoform X1 n=2 Tax=Cervus elaphus TaxID=9860 RepID=UPI001CC29F31|nr:reduced folate transporter isoform X1 [Cervus elaphus]
MGFLAPRVSGSQVSEGQRESASSCLPGHPQPAGATSRPFPGSMALSGPEVEKQAPEEPQPGREQQSWWCLVSFLCFYGFMAQMRPGESFITPYLLGPDKNFTQTQVTNEITPVLSYSNLAVLVPIFLLTDYLCYKPVLLLQGLSYVSVWLLLLFGSTVLHMQFMEFFFSITMAARIAYSSYIFSLVPPARYQQMASYSRASVLLGVFTSSVLGQLLVTMGRVPFSTLNYISLAFLTFSLVLALFLKRPKRSLFFNRGAPVRAGAAPSELDQMNPGQAQAAGAKRGWPPAAWRDSTFVRMLGELGRVVQLPQLRLWSLWWVFNSAGYYLIVYYVHILWKVVNPTTDTTRVYNGGADAASTLLGALTSFAAGFVKIRWVLWARLVIAVVTLLQAGLVFLMYKTDNIWLCYVAFVLFRGSYQFLVPIATFQIAASLSQELRALVFGINTFLATVLKTIITLIVSDKRGLGLPVHSQAFLQWVLLMGQLSVGADESGAPGLTDLGACQPLSRPLPPSSPLSPEKNMRPGTRSGWTPGASARAGPLIPHLLRLLPAALRRLLPCRRAGGPAPLRTEPPPAPAACPGAGESRAREGHAGRSPAPSPRGWCACRVRPRCDLS